MFGPLRPPAIRSDMLPSFGYRTPKTLEQACDFLWHARGRAKIIAGGTDLVIQLRNGLGNPETLVDITHLPELRSIEERDGTVRVGAATTHAELARSPLLREYGSILSEAAARIGSPQIRNLGTIGGNVVNASPAADTVPALLVLGATATIISREGEREVAIGDLFRGPYESHIGPHEILVSVSFPRLPKDARTNFIRVARREALAIARLSIAVVLRRDSARETIQDIRIALGAVTPVPQRFAGIEDMLRGGRPGEDRLRSASLELSEAVIRLSGIRPSTPYKKSVLESLFVRAIQEALED